MITSENLKFAFDNLTSPQINNAMNSKKDYVLFELHHFNSGSISYLNAYVYSEKRETEALNSGQVFCDKDTFLQLFKESESANPFLIELI